MNLRVVVEKDDDVYVAYCPELPGCVTYAKTVQGAKEKIKEAIELYLRPAPMKKIPNRAKVYKIAI